MPLIACEDVLEQLPVALAVFDAPGWRLDSANPAFAQLLGRPEMVLAGCTPAELLGPIEAEPLLLDLKAVHERGQGLRREWRRLLAGELRILELQLWPYTPRKPQDAGNPKAASGVMLTACDVTEQRVAEAARLESAITQRELLVKEVHHRIKNNLQGVAGLMQQAAKRHPSLTAVIDEAVAQVHAIAQVYGLQVGGGGRVPLDELLQAVAASLRGVFGREVLLRLPHRGALAAATAGLATPAVNPVAPDAASSAPLRSAPHPSRQLWAHLDEEPTDEQALTARWALPEAQAIPVALAVNELLTNALKHGAPHEVRCALMADVQGATVEISNRGHWPSSADAGRAAPGVSGLGLVKSLLPRRHATLELTQQMDEVVARLRLDAACLDALDTDMQPQAPIQADASAGLAP